ncbi:unnamed protein product [Dracunculus medinensis]|uniref:SET domain-containing protein n=1 Tax=Dracunculus medinensis TaxID=318479 RepID=A0A0N4UCI1_DRAME|nr:unnamed protein product [Dracunculus medinensis]
MSNRVNRWKYEYVSDIERDAEKLKVFISFQNILSEHIGPKNLTTELISLENFGKILINVFSLFNSELSPYGIGLYLGLSVLDHSCQPNAFVIFDGKKAILRSLSPDIDTLSDRVKISYIDLFDCTEDRQAKLLDIYFFTCRCSVCNDQQMDALAHSFRCSRCKDGYIGFNPKSSQLESCASCNIDKLSLALTDGIKLMDKVKKKAKQLDGSNYDERELISAIEIYHEAEKHFSSFNIPLCCLADSIAVKLIIAGNFDCAIGFVEKILPAFQKFCPYGYPSLAVQSYKLGKLLAQKECNINRAIIQLEQAVGMLKIAFGENHPNTVDALESILDMHLFLQQKCAHK